MKHVLIFALLSLGLSFAAHADTRVSCNGNDMSDNDLYQIRIETVASNLYVAHLTTTDAANGSVQKVDYDAQGTLEGNPLKINLLLYTDGELEATLVGGEKAHFMFKHSTNKMANVHCDVN